MIVSVCHCLLQNRQSWVLLNIFSIEILTICLEEASEAAEVSRESGFPVFIYICPEEAATETHQKLFTS